MRAGSATPVRASPSASVHCASPARRTAPQQQPVQPPSLPSSSRSRDVLARRVCAPPTKAAPQAAVQQSSGSCSEDPSLVPDPAGRPGGSDSTPLAAAASPASTLLRGDGAGLGAPPL